MTNGPKWTLPAVTTRREGPPLLICHSVVQYSTLKIEHPLGAGQDERAFLQGPATPINFCSNRLTADLRKQRVSTASRPHLKTWEEMLKVSEFPFHGSVPILTSAHTARGFSSSHRWCAYTGSSFPLGDGNRKVTRCLGSYRIIFPNCCDSFITTHTAQGYKSMTEGAKLKLSPKYTPHTFITGGKATWQNGESTGIS